MFGLYIIGKLLFIQDGDRWFECAYTLISGYDDMSLEGKSLRRSYTAEEMAQYIALANKDAACAVGVCHRQSVSPACFPWISVARSFVATTRRWPEPPGLDPGYCCRHNYHHCSYEPLSAFILHTLYEEGALCDRPARTCYHPQKAK